jgi:hypothetical protein
MFDAILNLLRLQAASADDAQVVSAAVAFLGAIISVVGVLAALVAAGLILLQVRTASASQRETSARQFYENYLRLSFDFPALARGEWQDGEKESRRVIAFEKYEWFVSIMLNACEAIILYVAKGDQWIDAVRGQLTYHREYLRSPEFAKYMSHYSPLMQQLITEVMKDEDVNGEA